MKPPSLLQPPTFDGLQGDHPSTRQDQAFASVRSLALVVVVLWHWVFATVRWDENGPHSGNPLHVIPGGFLLTWFLQVMPLFFLVGGWASLGSLDRHQQRGGSDRAWVRSRVGRLAKPALPLAVCLFVAKAILSPWWFGVVLLAVSPLWFLAVYLPLTALTPFLVRCHRHVPRTTFCLTFLLVAGGQVARFVWHNDSHACVLLAFLTTWGLVYQVGFYLDRLRCNRSLAVRVIRLGLAGIGVCVALGFPASMVAVKGEPISNMGPPTVAIVMLGLFQAGLVARFADRFEQATLRMKVGALIRWIDANQMRIYVVHLPLWVAQLLILRSTSLRLSSTPSLHWLVVRPLWLFGPGLVLWGTLSLRARMSNASRTASDS